MTYTLRAASGVEYTFVDIEIAGREFSICQTCGCYVELDTTHVDWHEGRKP